MAPTFKVPFADSWLVTPQEKWFPGGASNNLLPNFIYDVLFLSTETCRMQHVDLTLKVRIKLRWASNSYVNGNFNTVGNHSKLEMCWVGIALGLGC